MTGRNPLLLLENFRRETRSRQSSKSFLGSAYRLGWRLAIRPIFSLLLWVLARRQGLHLPAGWERSHYLIRMILKAYEKETVAISRQIIQPGDLVIDVGAHIGYFTRFFAEFAGATGQVVAFEPHPTNFDLLSRNTARYANVTAVNKAVCDTDGKLTLHISSHTGSHSLILKPDAPPLDEIEVETVALDTFWEQRGCPPVHMIKIDVEGAEPLVLKGAERLVEKNPALKLIVEFCPENLLSAGVEPQAFPEQLRGYGFKLQAILPEGTLVNVDEVDMGEQPYVNLLCEKTPGPTRQAAAALPTSYGASRYCK